MTESSARSGNRTGIPISFKKYDVLKAHAEIVERLQGYMSHFAQSITEHSRLAAFVKNLTPLAKK